MRPEVRGGLAFTYMNFQSCRAASRQMRKRPARLAADTGRGVAITFSR
jgi:hypothetical protein